MRHSRFISSTPLISGLLTGLLIRSSRSRSSSTRIRSSAYCSLLFSCAMSSRSAGAEGMGGALTMGY